MTNSDFKFICAYGQVCTLLHILYIKERDNIPDV